MVKVVPPVATSLNSNYLSGGVSDKQTELDTVIWHKAFRLVPCNSKNVFLILEVERWLKAVMNI